MEHAKSHLVYKTHWLIAAFAIACMLVLAGCGQAPANSSRADDRSRGARHVAKRRAERADHGCRCVLDTVQFPVPQRRENGLGLAFPELADGIYLQHQRRQVVLAGCGSDGVLRQAIFASVLVLTRTVRRCQLLRLHVEVDPSCHLFQPILATFEAIC